MARCYFLAKTAKTAGRSQNARDACRMDAPGGALRMRSLWSDTDAERMVERYAQQGVGRDLALRVYTSRLLGGEPKLVLHGGGNTSVKTVVRDLLDEEVEVLCVKGSGWDMAAVEAPGVAAGRVRRLGPVAGGAGAAGRERGGVVAAAPARP